MSEAITFGKYDHLLGVWQDSAKERRARTAVIMVTAGMLHHAGPFRLHVDLADELAEASIPSLRFDLSGIGESLGVGIRGRSIDRAAQEIGQAIDWIGQRSGIAQVILFGVCSGADDSLHAAVGDSRVVGVVALDGCGYRTTAYHWHRLIRRQIPRILRLSKWRQWLRRRLGLETPVPASLAMGADIREFPPQEQAALELQSLADRGVRLHFIYTGGVDEYYNHADQFATMFPALKHNAHVSSVYFPAMDHVAFLVQDRAALVGHIAETIGSNVEADRSTGHPSPLTAVAAC